MDFDQRPLCLVRSKDFPQFEGAQQATIQMKINETNQCEYPTEWKQGFSPKEHLEMMQSAAMIQMQHAFQAEQARLADVRRAGSMAMATEATKSAMRGASLGAGAAIASTHLAAILAVF